MSNDPKPKPAGGRDALGRFDRPFDSPPRLGPDGQPNPRRRGKPTRFKHFKIDELLPPEHREAYEALLDDPTSTLPSLQRWLRAHGVNVSHTAISNHRTHRFYDLKGMREAAQMASTFCALSRKHGAGAIAEASHAKFEMMLMQNLFNLRGAPEMPREEWQSMAKLVGSALANRRTVEELREGYEHRAKQAAEETERAMKRGVSGKDVVQRMKDILGV
jgi:uncharacterized protein DUF3486